MKQVVHVFGKNYDLVPVKTRLAQHLGCEAAKEIYKIIFRHIITAISSSKYEQILFVEPVGSDQFLENLSWKHKVFSQTGNDLGQRIQNAFQMGIKMGFQKQVLIGSDAPSLDTNIIMHAFAYLDEADLVIAPAIDGGFSLIGIKHTVPELVTDVEWSSIKTLDMVLDNAKRLKLKWKLLSFINDIDTWEDLERFLKEKLDSPLRQVQNEIQLKLKNQYFNSPIISVIIPALNEENKLGYNLAALRSQLDAQDEVIVVDGASRDRTIEIARQNGAQVLESERGRAVQMNKGAQHAKGEVLLFLHADCQIKTPGLQAMRQALQNINVLGGCFSQEILGYRSIYRWIAQSGNWRARCFRIFYGDQGIFVRKKIFEKIGGYAAVQLFEDVIFSRKLKKLGQTIVLQHKIQTWPRTWESWGIVTVSIRNWVISILFYLGFSPNWLKRFYPDIR